ncbi:MAG: acyl-CoA dehydrogenase family protein [Bryobacteraceae bacterium]|jgi:acyl-CoA dehydrogenase
MTTALDLDWKQTLADLGPAFAERAAAYDRSDGFVAENYAEMRDARLFSALVPKELGGGGLSYSEVCSLIRGLGRCCGSTALTFSMHQHLIAAALWNYRHGKPGEKLLRAVADGEKILITTGATDWLASNGILEPCEGGYRFTAKKVFASGCLAGDLLVTSGQYDDPIAGRQVLHFPVSMAAEGVRIDRVWETMGMRGTGSHTVALDHVFVPEQAIVLRRPCGEYHPVWNVILTVALPLICAAYVGVAEAAAEKARASAARNGDDGVSALLIGEMKNELTTAQIALESMISNVNDLDVEITVEHANRSLIRKTIVGDAVKRTADKALEATGGSGYFRASGLDRMLRDAQAALFHPMQPKKQHRFTGRLAMGLDPVAN